MPTSGASALISDPGASPNRAQEEGTVPSTKSAGATSQIRDTRSMVTSRWSSTMQSRVPIWLLLLAFTDAIPLPYRRPSVDSSKTHPGEEEYEDIFTQILRSNKDSTVKLHHGDIVMARSYSAVKCTHCLWSKSEDGVVRVPYILAPDYSDQNKELITSALQTFTELTCINFIERTTETDYLNIHSGSGCWSSIGKVGGPQPLSLMSGGCMARGVVQHEIEHALGFYHEQSRSDRDDHVDVLWQYINEADWGEFDLVYTKNMDLPYDYSSVMHYGR
ncbi:hypothetical protein GDO81_011093 [Engystomops pustulosus]|uniref:Metalloendopeptidase n=1 Tax=Engystomops pustulosus TaxID=76066 RepID=A0AAV7C5X5_ENGPU|nr:hypothetical protein GDO81_011093 [Engystomops pustulosus]